MDFGLVTGIQKLGDSAVLTVDRAEYLVGDEAAAYYAAHPDQEPLDYAIVNDSTESLQFVVVPEALLYGQYLLGDRNHVRTTKITMTQLINRATPITQEGQPILVWMYHKAGTNGPVVYLAEQFTP